MNIVYVSDQYWPAFGGVTVSLDSFKNKLVQVGHNVSLFVPDYPNANEWDKEKNIKNVFRFRSYGLFFNEENRLVYRSEKKKIFEALDSIKPDLIHIHTEFTLAKIAISYSKKKNIPLVITAHTNWEELIHEYLTFVPNRTGRIYCRFRLRRLFNKADLVIVPTYLMEMLLNLYYVRTPMRIIPTGVDENYFICNDDNKEIKKEIKIADDPVFENIFNTIKDHKTMLFVGRVAKEKNIKFLINALHKLILKNDNLKLMIVGDGPDKAELEKYIHKMQLKDHVVFTGFIERSKLAQLYSIADVFVFASKVESQGLVILESMTCGTPVVAIGKMGTRELMGGDFGGYMVDDDLDLFVEKVDLLLNDPQIYKIKSTEALQEAKKWKIDVMASKMLRVYQTLVDKKNELQ
ncbi:MAG: glycosyltransferase [Oligoflexia bacterium]|nr:glycosyltransferase [Oligoflexia bacterium]